MTTGTWAPVALSALIEPGTSAGTHVDGAGIVVWRDTAGNAHAWEDRCPHRGMKMSFGFVRGDHIACLYHGWEYDGTGTCRHIPAHPDLDVPSSICIPRYGVTEVGGVIWALVPQGADAPQPEAPDGDALRTVYVDAPLAAVCTALGGVAGNATVVFTCGGVTVTGHLQAVDAVHTAIHCIVPETTHADARVAALAGLVALRRQIETGVQA